MSAGPMGMPQPTPLRPNHPTPTNPESKIGRSMAAIQKKIADEHRRLAASGTVKPYTIINFNPVDLAIDWPDSNLIQYGSPVNGIPSALNEAKGLKCEFEYEGQKYKGNRVTIKNAIVRPYPKDMYALQSYDDAADAVAEYDFYTVLPCEHSYAYLNEYYGRQRMGGVLIFEGDFHTIEKPQETLIVPCPGPQVTPGLRRPMEPAGKPLNRDEVLRQCFTWQRAHYEAVLAAAQSLWNQEEQRSNITDRHRNWELWGRERMGWAELPADWVFAKNATGEPCKNCGSARKSPKAMSCAACGRPYDLLAALESGEVVPRVYITAMLPMLPKEQFAKADRILRERRKMEALLDQTYESSAAQVDTDGSKQKPEKKDGK